MKNPNRLRMQIRTASKSDAEAITEVQIAAICEAYCDLLPAEELARIACPYRPIAGATFWPATRPSGRGGGRDISPASWTFEACEEEESPETVGEIAAIFVDPRSGAWGSARR